MLQTTCNRVRVAVLQELDLSRCGLRSLGASFARSGGFVSAPALGFADFSGNDLGAAPAALAALLRAAPKLRELRLGNCRRESGGGKTHIFGTHLGSLELLEASWLEGFAWFWEGLYDVFSSSWNAFSGLRLNL